MQHSNWSGSGVTRLEWRWRIIILLFLSTVPASSVWAFFPCQTQSRTATPPPWLQSVFIKDDAPSATLIRKKATTNHNHHDSPESAPPPPQRTTTLFPKSRISSAVEQCRRLLFLLQQRWFALRKALRFVFQKYTVYVLACENDTFYVGCTTHRRQRWRQHQSQRGGSAWTRRHRPLRMVEQYKRVSSREYLGLEAKVTAQYMWTYGVNRVRGAMFLRSNRYTVQDIDALVGFLGHFNDLHYNDVRKELLQTLPSAKQDIDSNPHHHQQAKMQPSKSVRKLAPKSTDVCFACGEQGHWARDCPTGMRCYVCGKIGHKAADCRNK